MELVYITDPWMVDLCGKCKNVGKYTSPMDPIGWQYGFGMGFFQIY